MKIILFFFFTITSFTPAYTQAVGVVTSSGAYAYDGSWHQKQIDGVNPKIVASDETVGVVTSTGAFVFSDGLWQPRKGLAVGDQRDNNITVSKGVVGIMTSHVGYAFSKGQWFPQAISGIPRAITSKNGNLLLVTDSHAYAFDRKTNKWSPAPLVGVPVEYTH